MNTTDYCLWLVMAFGVANIRIWSLIEHFGTPCEAFNALKSHSDSLLTDKEKTAVKTTHMEQVEIVMENCSEKGISVISYYDENYPKQLKNIPNPPIVLFIKGDISVFSDLCITVVGTREPSRYSLTVTEKICIELAKMGVVIVSGFALGVDSIAHRSAIVGGGKTIAVLGCGVDVDYPKENTKSKRVIQQRGIIISEFLPGTRPIPSNFPKRNRILSGLSMGTLVIEASETSGALITGESALEQGRDLFCIPPADIFDKRYQGVVKYLRDGAIPVFSHLDIIHEYYTAFTHKLCSISNNDYFEPVSESSVYMSEKKIKKREKVKDISKPESKTEPEIVQKDYTSLDEEQLEIVKILGDGTKYIDEISILSGKSVQSLYLLLTDMEFDGIVQCLPGKAYKLT